MLKMIVRTVALVAMMAVLAACQQSAVSGPKVAFVNANKVFKECKAGAAGVEYLKKSSEKYQSSFKEMQAEMTQNRTKANTAKFQKAISEYQTKMGAEQNRIITVINSAFSKALDNYRQEKGLDVILSVESALSYDKSADVSDDIVAAMDKMDIKIIPDVETAPEKAPVAAPEKASEKTPAKADKK